MDPTKPGPQEPPNEPLGGNQPSGHNTFDPNSVYRQGKYGYHSTFRGKIVAKRPRHYWTANDLARVSRYFARDIDKTVRTEEEAFNLFDFILQTLIHILNGVDVLRGFVGGNPLRADALGNIKSVIEWLQANKAWEEKWRPRWEKAWKGFWEGMNGSI